MFMVNKIGNNRIERTKWNDKMFFCYEMIDLEKKKIKRIRK